MGAMIIGVGNRYRSDDGVGPYLVELLTAHGIDAVAHSGEGIGLMDLWQGADDVVLIDAAMSGAIPGTLHRLDAVTTPVPKNFFRYSSHLFGVAEAVEMARALKRLPPALRLFGIEGQTFTTGTTLSPEVAHTAATVFQELTAGVKRPG